MRTRTLRPTFVFGAVLASISALPVQAQPELSPSQQRHALKKPPLINPEAQKLVETMMASYKALQSYSAQTHLELAGATRANVPLQTGQKLFIKATLAWEKPNKLHYEGTLGANTLLALADDKAIRAINPNSPGVWRERPRSSAIKRTGTIAICAPRNGGSPFNSTVYDSGGVSQARPLMTNRQSWLLQLKDAVLLEADPTPDSKTSLATLYDCKPRAIEAILPSPACGLRAKITCSVTSK